MLGNLPDRRRVRYGVESATGGSYSFGGQGQSSVHSRRLARLNLVDSITYVRPSAIARKRHAIAAATTCSKPGRGRKRMKLIWMSISIVLVIMITVFVQPQEHTPVLEQCRVDASAWAKADKSYMQRFPFSEISRRFQEMYDCTNADRPNESKYVFVGLQLSVEESHRAEYFITRHNLWNQFIAEDAQGKR